MVVYFYHGLHDHDYDKSFNDHASKGFTLNNWSKWPFTFDDGCLNYLYY